MTGMRPSAGERLAAAFDAETAAEAVRALRNNGFVDQPIDCLGRNQSCDLRH